MMLYSKHKTENVAFFMNSLSEVDDMEARQFKLSVSITLPQRNRPQFEAWIWIRISEIFWNHCSVCTSPTSWFNFQYICLQRCSSKSSIVARNLDIFGFEQNRCACLLLPFRIWVESFFSVGVVHHGHENSSWNFCFIAVFNENSSMEISGL